jgi:hypothetical protein
MMNILKGLSVVAALSLAAQAAPIVAAGPAGSKPVAPKPDLANQVEGRYFGDVISDARGSSRSEVRIIVTKIGANKIRVASDYPRLRSFESALSRYMQTIQNVGGDGLFLWDGSKSPPSLQINVDDASWAGAREP